MASISNSTITLADFLPLAGRIGRHGLHSATNYMSLPAIMNSLMNPSEWIKIAVLGGALETSRRLIWRTWNYIISYLFLTAYLEASEPCFQWMTVWLSQQRAWTKPRSVLITSPTYGDVNGRMRAPRSANATKSDKPIQFQPMHGTKCSFWYRGAWVEITRGGNMQMPTGFVQMGQGQITQPFLSFTILGGSHKTLEALISDARLTYKAKIDNRIRIWSSLDQNVNNWTTSIVRPKRSLSSVVLDEGIKELLLEDAQDFMASESWYAERGIPWRRGYLLHGCPGSGKTSLIHALAGELDLDIYVFTLSKRDMDDASLSKLVSTLPAKSIALMEDIDVAFTRNMSRELSSAESTDPANPVVSAKPYARRRLAEPGPGGGITLAGLLAAIDGVAAQEGRILFATTNVYSALDPALCRPGRLDLHIEFRLASREQAKALFLRFYPASHPDGSGEEDREPFIDLEEKVDLSSSPSIQKPPLSVEARKQLKTSILGLSSSKRLELAKEFASYIPEWEFSMAAIQGHLMRYKTRPFTAVAETLAWVESEQKNKKDTDEQKAIPDDAQQDFLVGVQ